MKKKLLALSVSIIAFTGLINAQDIPNKGFENWTKDTLFEQPANYSTSNTELIGTGLINASKVSPGTDGSFALKLENIDDGDGNVMMGYLADGGLNTLDGTTFTFYGGQPFTGQPDSLVGMFKYNMVAGDSALIVIGFKKQGATLSQNFFFIGGSSTSYKRFAFKINQVLTPPDSIVFAIVSGNLFSPNGPQLGSIIVADNIELKGTLAGSNEIANNSFENWDLYSLEDPNQWSTLNKYVVYGVPVSVTKTTDAAAGSFAARIESVSFFGDDTIGAMAVGSLEPYGLEGGFSYTLQPTLFSGKYKYTPTGNDVAITAITFFKYDEATEQRENLKQYFIALPAKSSYSDFSISILDEITADTADIILSATNFDAPKMGSVLFIDELKLDGTVGINNNDLLITSAKIYPNPTTDKLTIELNLKEAGEFELWIVDIQGRVISTSAYPDLISGLNKLSINTSTLSPGTYTYQLINKGNISAGKFTVIR